MWHIFGKRERGHGNTPSPLTPSIRRVAEGKKNTQVMVKTRRCESWRKWLTRYFTCTGTDSSIEI